MKNNKLSGLTINYQTKKKHTHNQFKNNSTREFGIIDFIMQKSFFHTLLESEFVVLWLMVFEYYLQKKNDIFCSIEKLIKIFHHSMFSMFVFEYKFLFNDKMKNIDVLQIFIFHDLYTRIQDFQEQICMCMYYVCLYVLMQVW